jgi:putative transcriptional regulator
MTDTPSPGGRLADPLVGRLLVANPRMGDPNFDRSVVLILAHGEDGALGVVLNRPSDTSVSEALPGWESVASEPAAVFVGGPVQQNTVIALAQAQSPLGEDLSGQDDLADLLGDGESPWAPVAGDFGTLDLEVGPDEAAQRVAGLRLFAGYAGWGPAQLEGEIGAGGWFVVDAEPGDELTSDPASLWRAVLRRQRSGLVLLAAYPDDPAMN